jgi:hypothetical protein
MEHAKKNGRSVEWGTRRRARFNNSGPLVTRFWSRQAHHSSPKRKRGLEFASLALRASMARMTADFEPCPIFLQCIARNRDDQGIYITFLLPESLRDVIAGHPRKAKVEQDQSRPVSACDFDGVAIAEGGHYVMAG